MALTTVLSVRVRPDRASTYEAQVHALAEKSGATKERFEWGAYQVTAGELGTIHFVTEAPDWTTIAAREPVDVFIRRVMGETEGEQMLGRLAECIVAERLAIGRDRPDLSQPIGDDAPRRAQSLVTLMRARPGGDDACEEVIRKVGQAAIVAKDPRRFTCYQTMVGDLRTYWIVTPLADVADLDRMLQPQELLTKAFGAEGALVYRTGMEAIEHMERQMTVLRPELSHAAWLGKVVGLRTEAHARTTVRAAH